MNEKKNLTTEETFALAVKNHKKNNFQIAENLYKEALKTNPNHPKGRNPYAHVAICVKEKFEKSYKDIPDEKFTEVVEYIDHLKKNPS